MNTNSELERIVSNWLEGRVSDPRPGSLQSALERADQTPQQRHRWLPRWFGRGRGATGGAAARDRNNPPNDRRNRSMVSIMAVGASVAALALAATLVVPQAAGEPDPAPGAGGPTHRVAADGSGDYQTINEALAAAEEGDTILVAPGTYTEYLLIDQDITLAGDGAREEIVVEFPEGGPVHDSWSEGEGGTTFPIVLEGSDAILRGLTIRIPLAGGGVYVIGGAPELADLSVVPDPEAQTSGDDDDSDFTAFAFVDGSSVVLRDSSWAGTLHSGGSSPTIKGNTITAGWMPLEGPGEAVVRGNTFLDGTGLSLYFDLTGIIEGNDLSGGSIEIGAASSLTVRDNVLRGSAPVSGGNTGTDFEIGINLELGSSAHIVGNAVADYSIGISVDQGTTATVEGNDLTDNEFGIAWDSEMTGAIEGNVVRGGSTGIGITDGAPSVTGNTVEGAVYDGIFVGARTRPTLDGNTLCGSETNLVIWDTADPVLGENEICPDGVAMAE